MQLPETSRHRREIPTPSIEYEYIWMNKKAFKGITAIAGTELLFCILCIPVIIHFCKKHLTFRNAGLKLTFLFVIGCILALISIPLFGVDSQLMPDFDIPQVCMARIWLLNVGFTLSVGALIVRVIYTAIIKTATQSGEKFLVRSSTITYLVVGLAIIDSIIVIAWQYRSAPYKDYDIKEIEYVGLMDERRSVIEKCHSDKASLIISLFCVYKGILLLVALILTIFWREKTEEFIQDLKQCQHGILSTVITSFIAVPAVLALRFHPNCSFVIGGLAISIEVAFLMYSVIWYKIKKAYQCKKGDEKEFSKYAVKERNHIPCLNNTYGCVFTSYSRSYYSEEFYESELGLSRDMAKEITTESIQSTSHIETCFAFDAKEHEDPLPSDLGTFDELYVDQQQPPPDEDEDEEEYVGAEDKTSTDGSSSSDSSDDSDTERDSPYLNISSTPLGKSAVSIHMKTPIKEEPVSLLPEDKMDYGSQRSASAKDCLPPIKSEENAADATKHPQLAVPSNKVLLPPIASKNEKKSWKSRFFNSNKKQDKEDKEDSLEYETDTDTNTSSSSDEE